MYELDDDGWIDLTEYLGLENLNDLEHLGYPGGDVVLTKIVFRGTEQA